MQRIILTILLVVTFTISNSQNLIYNSSFENNLQCPGLLHFLPQNVTYFWKGSPFCYCSIHNECDVIVGPAPFYVNYGAPQSTVGYQEPVSGAGYADIVSLNPSPNSAQASDKGHIYQKMRQKFDAGKKYHVGYHISLSDSSAYATPKFGIFFSANEPQFTAGGWPFLVGYMQCVNTTQALTDKTIWYKLEWEYTAQGAEEYITIGNNTKLNQLDTMYVGGGGVLVPNASYYFIDDVFVIPIKEYSQKICTANDSLQLQAIEAGTKYKWSNGDTTSSITVTQNGIYTLLTTHDSLYRRDTFNVMLNHPTNLVYNYLPNEVYIIQGANLGLQGPAGANYTYLWSNGDTTQNTLVNSNGTYTLQLTAQDGCMAFDTCEVKYITGKPNLSKGGAFTIVPNPNNGSFSISITDNLNNQTILTITNTLGQVIDKINLVSTITNYENTQLENGIYFYTVTEKNTILAKGKMIVQSK
jgi:hypothetical protein